MSENTNPWIENTGTVPDGVGPDTVIEVEYRMGDLCKFFPSKHNISPLIWTLEEFDLDIIRWRFV